MMTKRSESGTHPGRESATVEILIPAYNEAGTIAEVIQSMAHALPSAALIVFDDASDDATAQRAREAGASEIHTGLRRAGKGAALRALLARARADVLITIDADATYDARDAPHLVRTLLDRQLDMVSAARHAHPETASPWPPMHRTGNRLLALALHIATGARTRDPLTGYRALTRRFAQQVRLHANGFAIEAELEAEAVRLGAATAEITSLYRPRPPGSQSKLRTVRDGIAIATLIASRAPDRLR